MATTTVLSTSNLTELEVVNNMLNVVDIAPVSSITGSKDLEVETAINRFSKINRDFQTQGWTFNTRREVKYLRNTDNQVSIASNILSIQPVGNSYGKDYVLRENKVYDRDPNVDSFTLQNDVWLDIVELMKFEDLPSAARTYINAKCILEHERIEHADNTKRQVTQDELDRAWATLINNESRSNQQTIENNINVYSSIFGRD